MSAYVLQRLLLKAWAVSYIFKHCFIYALLKVSPVCHYQTVRDGIVFFTSICNTCIFGVYSMETHQNTT